MSLTKEERDQLTEDDKRHTAELWAKLPPEEAAKLKRVREALSDAVEAVGIERVSEVLESLAREHRELVDTVKEAAEIAREGAAPRRRRGDSEG